MLLDEIYFKKYATVFKPIAIYIENRAKGNEIWN